MSGSDEKQLKNIYAKEMASSKCMKMEYLRTIFAYLYSGGRSFWFFAIKYTVMMSIDWTNWNPWHF